MYTMADFKNYTKRMTDEDTMDIVLSDDGKLTVNGMIASKGLVKHLMTSPLMRSVIEMAIYQFDDPASASTAKAARKLLRKYA